ncbi:hypothetical protein MIR68_008832 [Amoeboaphelidium protococcarum]|nr:hypothetical protein MIR68_008832 [Amoeboaphelidium protococcarum]
MQVYNVIVGYGYYMNSICLEILVYGVTNCIQSPYTSAHFKSILATKYLFFFNQNTSIYPIYICYLKLVMRLSIIIVSALLAIGVQSIPQRSGSRGRTSGNSMQRGMSGGRTGSANSRTTRPSADAGSMVRRMESAANDRFSGNSGSLSASRSSRSSSSRPSGGFSSGESGVSSIASRVSSRFD